MKIGWVHISNYRNFRNVFESDSESEFVVKNLETAILKDIEADETAHIGLQYWVHYDDEGLVGFEVSQAKFAYGKAYINVNYLSTAK